MTLPLTDQLMTTVDAYCAAAKLSRSRVSTLIWGDGMRLEGIAQGKDLNTRSFERAMRWLSMNWPEALEWPEGIERPALVETGDDLASPPAAGAAA